MNSEPRPGASRRIVRVLLAGLIGVPFLVAGLSSVSIRWIFPQVLPEEFTTAQIRRVLGSRSISDALTTSIALSLVVAGIAMVLAWPAARALAQPRLRFRGAILAVLFLPSILPGVGLAMGVTVGLFNLGIYGSFWAVVLAHLIPVLPYAVATMTATFLRHDGLLEDQAATLGATPWQVWCHVTLPAVRSGVLAAASLAVVVSWSQYLLTVLSGSGRVVTLTVALFNAAAGGNPATIGVLTIVVAAPVAVMMVAPSRASRLELDHQ